MSDIKCPHCSFDMRKTYFGDGVSHEEYDYGYVCIKCGNVITYTTEICRCCGYRMEEVYNSGLYVCACCGCKYSINWRG